jgi:enoyl-CoA hydratase/carnithine racemase
MSDSTPASSAPGPRPPRLNIAVENRIGWIELANTAKHNAVSNAMWARLVQALAGFESDAAVHCVVIRGEGERAFSAGADISEKDRAALESGADHNRAAFAALAKVQAFPKPVVAMIHGHCLGAGLALALACDFRLASADANFALPAAKLGGPVHHALVRRLVDICGPINTKRIIFTAERFRAEDAQRFGLVDWVVAAPELRATVEGLVAAIAANAPLTIAAAKCAIEAALLGVDEHAIARCEALERACLDSADYAEGRRAFLEKRPPRFEGR